MRNQWEEYSRVHKFHYQIRHLIMSTSMQRKGSIGQARASQNLLMGSKLVVKTGRKYLMTISIIWRLKLNYKWERVSSIKLKTHLRSILERLTKEPRITINKIKIIIQTLIKMVHQSLKRNDKLHFVSESNNLYWLCIY